MPKCPYCPKEPKVYWGGVKVCGSRKCLDKAWNDYQRRPQRRSGDYGVQR